MPVDDVAQYRQGDSNFVLPDDFNLKITVVGAGATEPSSFRCYGNAAGRLGAVEFVEIRSRSPREAYFAGANRFADLAALFATVYDVPLLHSNYICRADDASGFTCSIYVGWNTGTLLKTHTFHSSLRKLMRMYADGVRSNSPAYEFLSFFKIVDYVLRIVPRLRPLYNSCGLSWQPLNPVLNGSGMRQLRPDLIGKKLTFVRDAFNAEFRRAIAHFSPDDALESFAAEAGGEIMIASVVLRECAGLLIEAMGSYVIELTNAGISENSISEALAPPISRRR